MWNIQLFKPETTGIFFQQIKCANAERKGGEGRDFEDVRFIITTVFLWPLSCYTWEAIYL